MHLFTFHWNDPSKNYLEMILNKLVGGIVA